MFSCIHGMQMVLFSWICTSTGARPLMNKFSLLTWRTNRAREHHASSHMSWHLSSHIEWFGCTDESAPHSPTFSLIRCYMLLEDDKTAFRTIKEILHWHLSAISKSKRKKNATICIIYMWHTTLWTKMLHWNECRICSLSLTKIKSFSDMYKSL